MSRFIDSITKGPKQEPEEKLLDLLVSHVGPRRGLPSLDSQQERPWVIQALQEALTSTSEEELRHLIRWIFECSNEFWRERLMEAKFFGGFFTASLSTMLEQYRDDVTAPNYMPRPLTMTQFMSQLKTLTPKGRS